MMTPSLLLFNLDIIVSAKRSLTLFLVISDWASPDLSGSSIIIKFPPQPVIDPSIPVAYK